MSEDGSLCLVYNDDLPDDPYTQTLHVFDKDGKEFFSKRVPSIDSAGISSDGDYFFAGTSHFTRGRLYARSGDLQWNYKISQLSYILANPRTSISGDLNLIGIAGLGWVTGLDKSGNELFNKSLAYMVEERPAYRKPLVYVDVSGEGNRLVTGSESVVYCLNDTGSVLWSFEFENKKISDDIGSGAITNDGKIVAVSSGNYILIFDENRDVRSQYKTDLPVKRIFISDDGGVIAGGARNGILYLLSDETGLISVDVGSLPVQPLPTQGIPGDTTPTNEQTAPVFLFLPLIAFAITAVLQRRKK